MFHASSCRLFVSIIDHLCCIVDLSSWREKMEADLSADQEGAAATQVEHHMVEEEPEETRGQHEAYRNGVLTIGCCGYPNVGKSSLINGLMGRKVRGVSVWCDCASFF